MAIYNYENEFQLEKAFPMVTNRVGGRNSSEQAWIQMAAYGVCLGIAMFSGALCGFLSNLMPHLEMVFDDDSNFDNVLYGDNLDQYNADPDAEVEPVPNTARTDADMSPIDLPDELKADSDKNSTDSKGGHLEMMDGQAINQAQ